MLGGSLGGRSRRVTPGGQKKPPLPKPLVHGKVWGTWDPPLSDGDQWINANGVGGSGGFIFPPDPDSYSYDGDTLEGQGWLPGGSDGVYHYHLDISLAGQWYVAKFDAPMLTLLDRWEVTGYTVTVASADGGESQNVCADKSHVVVVTNGFDGGDNAILVTVFTTGGTIADQHVILTPDLDEFGSHIDLAGGTGSCTDGTFVYFWIDDFYDPGDGLTTTYSMVKVELSTGTMTVLWQVQDVVLPEDSNGLGPSGLIVLPDIGDLVTGGGDLNRVTQDGTLVWNRNMTGDDIRFYQAVAHSGNRSVWAFDQGQPPCDEWTFEGVYLRSASTSEGLQQAWLINS